MSSQALLPCGNQRVYISSDSDTYLKAVLIKTCSVSQRPILTFSESQDNHSTAIDHTQWASPGASGVLLRRKKPYMGYALLQGMSEDVSINKFFDDPMLLELAKQDAEMQPMY